MEKNFYFSHQARRVTSVSMNTAGSPAVPEHRPDLPLSCNTELPQRRSLQRHRHSRGKPRSWTDHERGTDGGGRLMNWFKQTKNGRF
jgi:hypothetical protein